MCGSLGLDDEALGWLERALPVARERGTAEELGRLLIDFGFGLGRMGKPEEGLPYAEEGLALVAEVEGTRFRSAGHLTVGVLAGQVGDLERQWRAFDEVLTMSDRPHAGIHAIHKSIMGRALRETGQQAAALDLLQANLAEIQGMGMDVIEADTLGDLGAVFLETGDFSRALENLEAGLAVASRHPAEHREAPLLKLFGEALAAVGRLSEAHEAWQRAATLYDREADPRAADVRSLLDHAAPDGGSAGRAQ
jgi:tetratricopeptide (TPR) repeat protein